MSFAAQLTAFAKGTQDRIDKTVKGATTVLFTNVITATPVDQGTAKGNWQAGVGSPVTGVLDVQDPSGQATIAKAAEAIPEKAGNVVYLSNNLPYIKKLEYGHSQQAPAGMVRTSAVNWPQIVEHEAAKHR